ncbi:hypothetical protein P4233_25195 [Pseudomonas aeruginosa]|nr:hypothetical protein [Pseudomonas aeruginosa]
MTHDHTQARQLRPGMPALVFGGNVFGWTADSNTSTGWTPCSTPA